MPWNPCSVAVCVALPVLVSILLALLLFSPHTSPPVSVNPGDTSSAYVMSEDTSSGHVMSEDTSSGHVISEDTSSANVISEDTSSGHVMSEDTGSDPSVDDPRPSATSPYTAPTAAPYTAPTDAPYTVPTSAPDTAPTDAPYTVPNSAPDTASTAALDTASTSAPDTAHTSVPDTAPTSAPDTAPTSAPDTAPTAAPNTASTAAPYAAPTAAPYTDERVVMQPLDSESSSLTGSLCGHYNCSTHYDDGVTDVLVTSDRRVVLTMLFQQSIVVQSSSGVQTVTLGCAPGGVTELPSRRIAVTCPDTPAVLLVSLESSDHQIQRIPTGKQYRRVAAHPVDQTLIVGTGTSIDVITLQGKVVRTLVDTHQWSVTAIFSLTVASGSLLVTGAGRELIHRIHLSDSSQPPMETLAGSFPSWPMDTAVDKAGNVFIVLQDGGVLMRNTEGPNRQLLAGGEKYWRCYITLHGNRLLVATRIINSGQWKSVVTEYQLNYLYPSTSDH